MTSCVLDVDPVRYAVSLQAIQPLGRELALTRGANVVMPILTPTDVRVNYQLYPGKPCISHAAEGCVSCLKLRIESIGKSLRTDGTWADPPHFKCSQGKQRALQVHRGQGNA